MDERELFSAALTIRDDGERAAFLKKSCAGNAALRRRIEALLNAHVAAEGFLQRATFEDWLAAGPGPAADADPVATDSVSDEVQLFSGDWLQAILSRSTKAGALGRLGHYEVEAILGRGGFGTVLRAFDERLHRTVAIKLLSPELATTSPPRKRFLREARAAAAIRHPNVVAIHAVEDSPLPHLVMEYIPGQTLQQIIDGHGPLDVDDVVRIAEQIAAGLAAAHARGLIHRDIKPSNILLEGGLRGCVKISDFGLARTADDATLTQSGTVAGTPLYMSPEQAQGQAIDHRSDLFSLGSVLYVMISGRPPFRAPTTMAVLKRVVEDAPRPMAEIIPETPDWLCAIIAKLHAKSPDDRFQTAREVGELLGACLASLRAHRAVELPAGIPPAPRPIPAGVRTRRVAGRMKPAPAMSGRRPSTTRRRTTAAVVALVMVVGLGLSEATGVTRLAATIIRVTTGSGTLVIETDDPGVSVTVDGEELKIHGAGVQELTLKPGSYRVEAFKDGQRVSQELATITRGGREVLRVTRERIAADPPEAAGATPPMIGDPDRRAAEWALSVGIPVDVSIPGDQFRISPGESLPAVDFQLLSADLRVPQGRDANLATFAGCRNLRSLLLLGEHVTDTGAANFRSSKGLRELYLHNTSMTDDGLLNFEGCRELTHFSLSSRGFTDKGLAIFRDCHIRVLDLTLSQVTDAGLAQFQRVELLAGLQLNYTAVTDAGLNHFRSCAVLDSLDLTDTAVSDAGLSQLRNCSKLTNVNLENTRIGDNGLAALRDCRELSVLVLNGTRVTDAGVTDLRTYSNLKDLRLRRTSVTASRINALHQSLPACRIEWDGGVIEPHAADADRTAATWALSVGAPVEISAAGRKRTVNPGEPLPGEPFQLLYAELRGNPQLTEAGAAHFAGCRNLTHLNLPGAAVTDAVVAHFRDCQGLVRLDLENSAVTDAGLLYFEGCAGLTTLILNNTSVSDAGLAAFDGCRELRFLQLGRTKVTDAGLGNFRDCPHLEEISLGYTAVTDRGLASFRNCPGLRHLNLIATDVSDAGIENFRDCPDLESLVLSETHVTDAGLANFRNCRKLVRINLDHLGVTDRGLDVFSACTQLTELTLFGARFTDAGIGRFGQCRDLTHLLLDNTPLTDAGWQHFRECNNLQRVHLDNTQLTDAGLAQFQNYRHLGHLTLTNTPVGDKGLAAFRDLRELTWLRLSGTQLTDAGLAELKQITSLTDLDLHQTSVTAAGVEGLHQALPRCRIVWDGGTIEP